MCFFLDFAPYFLIIVVPLSRIEWSLFSMVPNPDLSGYTASVINLYGEVFHGDFHELRVISCG
jgi:hypothetical protein